MSASTAAPLAWSEVQTGWRRLYGDFDSAGISVEAHDFRSARDVDWGASFRPRSVEFCFNVDGRAAVGAPSQAAYAAGTSGFYSFADEPLTGLRGADDHHHFVTLEFSRSYLQEQLRESEADLGSQIRNAVFAPRQTAVVSQPLPMSREQRNVLSSLLSPPVPRAAQTLWYQSKALELMAHFLFSPKDPELFCVRQKRVARDRVERVKELLARDLANPPALEQLGQQVGCSPFHLSRIFSREVGLTIPQYLRNIRMERAADLLRTGRYNVTEAATEVGYSSLSHFSKAFCETIGCCPALYPLAKHIVLDR